MIELLIVITVITLMMALLVGASYRFVVGAREAATATTVTKASGIIQDRMRAFREFDVSDSAIAFTNTGAVGNVSLAEVLVRKMRFKKAFPQAFAELDASQLARFFPSYSVNNPPYPTSPATAGYNPKFESGIVLYAVLTKGETFGAATPGEDTFSGSEVKNSAETGNLPCLVDAWGEPIRFYRWPTRLIRCGEQDFDGNGVSDGNGGTYDDYNRNGSRDGAGSGSPFVPPYSAPPAIRPDSMFAGPTPASVLMRLPTFDRGSPYATGADQAPGAAGGPYPSQIGWPGTDDPESMNVDPDDPSFKLSDFLTSAPQMAAFVSGTSGNRYADAFHDYYTFHTPLIVSAGPDKQLGLYEPNDVPTSTRPQSANYGYLAAPSFPLSSGATYPTRAQVSQTMQILFDNISNLNQRAGGK